jgi:hypothetical protein
MTQEEEDAWLSAIMQRARAKAAKREGRTFADHLTQHQGLTLFEAWRRYDPITARSVPLPAVAPAQSDFF